MGAESFPEGITVDVLSGGAGADRTTQLLLGRLAIIVADEKGIKQLTGVKGSS